MAPLAAPLVGLFRRAAEWPDPLIVRVFLAGRTSVRAKLRSAVPLAADLG